MAGESNAIDKVNTEESVDKCNESLKSHCTLSDTFAKAGNLGDSNLTGSDEFVVASENVSLGDKIISRQLDENFLLGQQANHFQNVKVYNSQNVHIGNVTHIHGTVLVNQNAAFIKQNIINNDDSNKNIKEFPIVPRCIWLAQPPMSLEDVQCFTEPAKHVIICHSASEEAYTQTDNNLLVRLIQQFHVESRKWNDIGYNFLAGADGSIYEGRGWNVVGSHTRGYNFSSIGICFVGCFINKLPPPAVLEKVKKLIRYGVEIGAISQNYVLLAHRQCRSTASPGNALYEEVKTWERWDSTIYVENF